MFIDKLIKPVEPKDYTKVAKNLKEIMHHAISIMIEDKPMFALDQFDFIFADECVTKTNVNEVGEMMLFVELSNSDNIKTDKKKRNHFLYKSRNMIPDLHFTLEKYKKNLQDILISIFDSTASFYTTKYGFIINQACELQNGGSESYSVYVIPCLSYLNEQGTNGVMFYDDYKREVEIRYPKTYIKNFKAKDKQTNGLYSKYCVLAKNLFLSATKEDYIPTEIFDTIMYNVPSNMYISMEYQDIVKVINYLRNVSLGTLKTIDEQDFAFTSELRSMSYLYAKNAIKQIGKGLNNLNKTN